MIAPGGLIIPCLPPLAETGLRSVAPVTFHEFTRLSLRGLYKNREEATRDYAATTSGRNASAGRRFVRESRGAGDGGRHGTFQCGPGRGRPRGADAGGQGWRPDAVRRVARGCSVGCGAFQRRVARGWPVGCRAL